VYGADVNAGPFNNWSVFNLKPRLSRGCERYQDEWITLLVLAMTTDQVFGYTGELNDDPDIYHILSEATAGDNFHGYKQVWLTTGGNNPSYPEELGGDNPVPSGDWETFDPRLRQN
jgi:hypothetical protein